MSAGENCGGLVSYEGGGGGRGAGADLDRGGWFLGLDELVLSRLG